MPNAKRLSIAQGSIARPAIPAMPAMRPFKNSSKAAARPSSMPPKSELTGVNVVKSSP